MTENATGKNSDSDIGIIVKSVGLGWYHPGGFVIDRPAGHADWSFVQWLTPTILKTNEGVGVEAPGGCIFYRPGTPQWYGSDIFTPFGNHWFHFNGPAAAALMEELDIPVDRPIRPARLKSGDFIESSIRAFLREAMSENIGRHTALSAKALLFLVEFGRILNLNKAKARSVRNMELQEKFEHFRERLREQCVEPWTIGKMAAELHLSPSRFSNLYREFFAAKPVDDLIRMRLELAGYYLRTTVMPVNYVANLCGFTDIYYFSRAFKAKMGMTPTAYRSENGDEQSA